MLYFFANDARLLKYDNREPHMSQKTFFTVFVVFLFSILFFPSVSSAKTAPSSCQNDKNSIHSQKFIQGHTYEEIVCPDGTKFVVALGKDDVKLTLPKSQNTKDEVLKSEQVSPDAAAGLEGNNASSKDAKHLVREKHDSDSLKKEGDIDSASAQSQMMEDWGKGSSK